MQNAMSLKTHLIPSYPLSINKLRRLYNLKRPIRRQQGKCLWMRGRVLLYHWEHKRTGMKDVLTKLKEHSLRTAEQIHSFTGAYSPGRTFDLPFGVSWSHTYRHTVGLLWTSDQPVAETSTCTGQHNIETSMPRAGFEPATPATKRPQTYALDRAPKHSCVKFLQVINSVKWIN
jgi:hypothetical protein